MVQYSFIKKIFWFVLMATLMISVDSIADAKIEGVVKDIFGNGIKGVNVQIENTGFTASTNKSGKYSIDYVPGNITLIYSKTGFTTQKLPLSIYEKSKFPAAPIEMWPIPSQGIYFVDENNKQLVKVETSFDITSRSRKGRTSQYDAIGFTQQEFLATERSNLKLPAGKLTFIDTIPEQIALLQLSPENILLSVRLGGYGMVEGIVYDGKVEGKTEKMGEEKLIIRKFDLHDGIYAWVELKTTKNAYGQITTFPKGSYYPFYAGNVTEDVSAKDEGSGLNIFGKPKEQKKDSTSPKTSINIDSKYYKKEENQYAKSGFGGQCTAFAWGRAYEKKGIKLKFKRKPEDDCNTSYPHAKCWFNPGPVDELNLKLGNEPYPDSIAIWDGKKGHVAYIEKVENGYVYFNEANFDKFKDDKYGGGYDGEKPPMKINEFENRKGGSISKFLGYLYLAKDSTTAKQADKSQPKTLDQAVEDSVGKVVDGIFKGLFGK